MKFCVVVFFYLCFLNVFSIPISFKDVDSVQLFEGDIAGVVFEEAKTKSLAVKLSFGGDIWSEGTVPYMIKTQDFTSNDMDTIYKGMRMIEDQTRIGGKDCIKFQPYSDETNWITIKRGTSCWSYVGKSLVSGSQDVNLNTYASCFSVGGVSHELIHSLGFWHEQSRPDRDNYVKIYYENIQPGEEFNFDKYTTDVDTLGLSYDYNSIMHYPPYAFSANGKPTILPKAANFTIGDKQQLSETDVQMIRKYYSCSGNTLTRSFYYFFIALSIKISIS